MLEFGQNKGNLLTMSLIMVQARQKAPKTNEASFKNTKKNGESHKKIIINVENKILKICMYLDNVAGVQKNGFIGPHQLAK